jgi:hypothetical protein
MKQSEQVEDIFPVGAKQSTEGLSKIWSFGNKKYQNDEITSTKFSIRQKYLKNLKKKKSNFILFFYFILVSVILSFSKN